MIDKLPSLTLQPRKSHVSTKWEPSCDSNIFKITGRYKLCSVRQVVVVGRGGGAHSTGRGLLYNRGTKTIYGKYLCSSSNHQEQIVGEAESTRKFPTEFWISVSARPWLADCPLSSLLTDVLMYCVCAWPPCKECQYHPLVIRGTGTSRQMRISTTPWQHQTIPSPAPHPGNTRQYHPLPPTPPDNTLPCTHTTEQYPPLTLNPRYWPLPCPSEETLTVPEIEIRNKHKCNSTFGETGEKSNLPSFPFFWRRYVWWNGDNVVLVCACSRCWVYNGAISELGPSIGLVTGAGMQTVTEHYSCSEQPAPCQNNSAWWQLLSR